MSDIPTHTPFPGGPDVQQPEIDPAGPDMPEIESDPSPVEIPSDQPFNDDGTATPGF